MRDVGCGMWDAGCGMRNERDSNRGIRDKILRLKRLLKRRDVG